MEVVQIGQSHNFLTLRTIVVVPQKFNFQVVEDIRKEKANNNHNWRWWWLILSFPSCRTSSLTRLPVISLPFLPSPTLDSHFLGNRKWLLMAERWQMDEIEFLVGCSLSPKGIPFSPVQFITNRADRILIRLGWPPFNPRSPFSGYLPAPVPSYSGPPASSFFSASLSHHTTSQVIEDCGD